MLLTPKVERYRFCGEHISFDWVIVPEGTLKQGWEFLRIPVSSNSHSHFGRANALGAHTHMHMHMHMHMQMHALAFEAVT